MKYSSALEAQLQWLRWTQAHRPKPHPVLGPDARVDYAIGALEYGETFYWSHEIAETVVSAVKTLPTDWAFTRTLLPTDRGFFWFDGGATLKADGQERWLRVECIAWSTGIQEEDQAVTTQIVVFTNQYDEPSKTAFSLTRFVEGESLTRWGGTLINEAKESGDQPWPALGGGCVFAACLLCLQQRIFVASEQRIERHARKRVERAGFQHEPVVRVIELRRAHSRSEHHGESDAVAWTHQWIVSGHWRQQWYPSLNTNQPRWIMPYVKGPEDKPLKPPRAKVFAVVR